MRESFFNRLHSSAPFGLPCSQKSVTTAAGRSSVASLNPSSAFGRVHAKTGEFE